MKVLECAQGTSNLVKGLEGISYGEQKSTLGMSSYQKGV